MSESPHEIRFPGETDAYRAARDELLRAEIDLRARIENVAALRRGLPLGGALTGRRVTRPVVILKTGSTFPDLAATAGDFEDWTRDGLGLPRDRVSVVPAAGAEALPAPGSVAGVVITGAHEMVTDDPPWLEAVCAWLRDVARHEVPVLGICYGHQLLAHAFGGRVGYGPEGREVGTVTVRATAAAGRDPLLGAMPPAFPAHATHAQYVLEPPGDMTLLGTTDRDPHHAFRIGGCVWGVQFHPEYSEAVMAEYARRQRAELADQGEDAGAIAAAVSPSPAGSLLAAFAALAARRDRDSPRA